MSSAFDLKDLAIKRASSNTDVEELLNELRKINSKNTVVQIFDDNFVLSRMHLVGAYINALVAFKNNANKTKSLAMEMLLFASMTDQIEKALRIAGAKTTLHFILFSNRRDSLTGLKKFVKMGSDFSPSVSEIRRTAKRIGMESGAKSREEIDFQVLQRMALSRLGSD